MTVTAPETAPADSAMGGATTPPDPAPLSRALLAAVALCLVVHVVLAWLVRQPVVASANDDALYLLLGRALRAGTYRDLHVVGTPWHSQYPPGYPLLLALFGGTLGPGILGPVLLGIGLSTLMLLAAFDLARRFAPPAFAVALLAMLAVSPHLLAFAGSVRSEIPYAALSLAGLWCLVRWPGRRAAVVAGVAAVVLAGLTRTVGLALVGAVALTWVLERRWRRLAGFTVIAGLTVGLWLLWTFTAPAQFEARSYGVMLTQGSPAERDPIGLITGRVARSITSYLGRGSLGSGLGLPWIPGTSLDNIVGVAGTLFLAGLGMAVTWRRARVLTLYVLCFAALLVAWTYKLTRFVVPITPVILLLTVIGAAHLARRWRPLPRAALLAGLLLIYLTGGVQGFQREYAEQGGCPADDVTSPAACITPIQRGFFQAVTFLRDSTVPEAVLISTKEAVLGLYTDHRVLHSQAIRVRLGEDPLGGLRSLGAVAIVLSHVHLWQVPPAIIDACSDFEVVRSYPEGTDVLRLRDSAPLVLPAVSVDPALAGRACEVIRAQAGLFVPPL
jgi:hypothetical protein